MKKQLTAFLAVSLTVLSACAVEGELPEQETDESAIETAEQPFGEALCGAAGIVAPSGPLVSRDASCPTFITANRRVVASSSASYGYFGCPNASIFDFTNMNYVATGLGTSNVLKVFDNETSAPATVPQCQALTVTLQAYVTTSAGTTQLPAVSQGGTWGTGCTKPSPQMTLPTQVGGLPVTTVRVTAQSRMNATLFNPLTYRKVRTELDSGRCP